MVKGKCAMKTAQSKATPTAVAKPACMKNAKAKATPKETSPTATATPHKRKAAEMGEHTPETDDSSPKWSNLDSAKRALTNKFPHTSFQKLESMYYDEGQNPVGVVEAEMAKNRAGTRTKRLSTQFWVKLQNAVGLAYGAVGGLGAVDGMN